MCPSLHSERRQAATVDHCSKSSCHLEKEAVLCATKYFLAVQSVFDDVFAFQAKSDVTTVATTDNFQFLWSTSSQLNAIGAHEKNQSGQFTKKIPELCFKKNASKAEAKKQQQGGSCLQMK